LYAYWYAEVEAALAGALRGRVVELGSGPGIAKQFLPGILTSDIVRAPWHDYEIDITETWPFSDETLDGIVVFDVLHHVSVPRILFSEATRTLRPAGRLVVMEPYVSLCSYLVYRFLHDEKQGFDTSVSPLTLQSSPDKDPFVGNQALPGLVFGRYRPLFQRQFPELRLLGTKLYSGLSYVTSGGFSRPCLLPYPAWSGLFWLDRGLPRSIAHLTAFRMLAVLERAQLG